MNKFGYYRVCSAIPEVKVANPTFNANSIISLARRACGRNANLVVFPELCVCGYTCADLFRQSALQEASLSALEIIRKESVNWGDMLVIVGAPISLPNGLYNCAVVIINGEYAGIVPKTYLPNYDEFYEKRWFSSATHCSTFKSALINNRNVRIGDDLLFRHGDAVITTEICEDLWSPIPPSSYACLAGANVVANLSASDDVIGKYKYLTRLISQQSARCLSGYVYSSAGKGESTTDLVYSGNGVIAENGKIMVCSDRFSFSESLTFADVDLQLLAHERLRNNTFSDCSIQHAKKYDIIDCGDFKDSIKQSEELLRDVVKMPFVPNSSDEKDTRCEEITSIQTIGLIQRLRATGCRNLVVGVSGGLDSTLALLVAVKAFDMLGLDRKGIHGVTMPGFGTTNRTYENAVSLINKLGITFKEISIADAVNQHFKDLGYNTELHDVTYENSQARERTQILMDYANMHSGMVLGTGDLSELALGWCTYNADQMSMYGINASVPKTLVKHLVRHFAAYFEDSKLRATLLDIVDTPISPELLPSAPDGEISQKTEDLVGPYELHDFFMYFMLRHSFSPKKIYYLASHAFTGIYGNNEIKHWLKTFYRRFFSQQFKRSCMPDGPKTGSVCLSPRGDWRMPSDASAEIWIKECDVL